MNTAAPIDKGIMGALTWNSLAMTNVPRNDGDLEGHYSGLTELGGRLYLLGQFITWRSKLCLNWDWGPYF